MIRINLLPPKQAGKRGKLRLPLSGSGRLLGIGGGGAIAIFSLLLWVVTGVQARSFHRLQSERESMEAQRPRVEESRKALDQLQKRWEAIEGLKSPAARWAPRLNLLSDAVVPRLWFTSLHWSRGEPLQLRGSALTVASRGENGVPVSRFLQRLKSHPDFSRWFQKADLESVQHRQVRDEEVVDFSIQLVPTE